jgi:DNA-binding protein YbaB
MFNKLKQFKDLRNQAKTMQNALAQESVTLEKNGIVLTINGNLEITNLKIENDLSKEKIESTMKDLFNDAVKKVQRIMAEKMRQMGGLSGLSGLGM